MFGIIINIEWNCLVGWQDCQLGCVAGLPHPLIECRTNGHVVLHLQEYDSTVTLPHRHIWNKSYDKILAKSSL